MKSPFFSSALQKHRSNKSSVMSQVGEKTTSPAPHHHRIDNAARHLRPPSPAAMAWPRCNRPCPATAVAKTWWVNDALNSWQPSWLAEIRPSPLSWHNHTHTVSLPPSLTAVTAQANPTELKQQATVIHRQDSQASKSVPWIRHRLCSPLA